MEIRLFSLRRPSAAMSPPILQMHLSIHTPASPLLSFSSQIVSDPTHLFLISSFSRLSIAKPPPSTMIRMGGGPRTFPGGVSKWQWKRMQAKKAKQLLRARLARERQVYEMRKRAELSAAISELERPWEVVEKAPKLFSTSADEQLKVLADRFQKPGGFDLWSEKDGPQLFETVDGIPSARFFPKGVVHSIKPYGRISDGYSPEEPDLVHRDEHDEKSRKFEKNNTGIGYPFSDDDSGLILRNGHEESLRNANGKSTKKDSRRRIRTGLDSGRDGVNQKDSGSICRKDTKRGNGRTEHSASNSEVFDMSLQDDGSYGILKEEMKITKNRQEHRGNEIC
ncbi:unnamed protein product [Lactuca virosa]|uniref:DEAD-box ATP-dependent RNA helicase 33 n=1 Tax=Lactuca virosa TaxID=75947 RepID=A0AAU9NBB6_9ASTR|nr:unnamed protein product [Lactuca virosa]